MTDNLEPSEHSGVEQAAEWKKQLWFLITGWVGWEKFSCNDAFRELETFIEKLIAGASWDAWKKENELDEETIEQIETALEIKHTDIVSNHIQQLLEQLYTLFTNSKTP